MRFFIDSGDIDAIKAAADTGLIDGVTTAEDTFYYAFLSNIGVEEFVDVPGYEGKYQISNLGRVKSLKRKIKAGKGFKVQPELIRKPFTDRDGYHRVNLSSNKAYQTFIISRLMLQVFHCEQSEQELVCRHIDSNPSNNRLCNLKWGTQKENIEDRTNAGNTPHGSKNGMAVITEEDVKAIRRFHHQGQSMRSLGRQYGMSAQNISRIVNHVTWQHVLPDKDIGIPIRDKRKKLSNDSIRLIRKRYAAGVSITTLAKSVNLSRSSLSDIIHKRTYKEI